MRLELVDSKTKWNDFIELPWPIYKNDPFWVPPLRIAVKDLLDVNKNPFFKHALMYPLIAYSDDGKALGRIVGVIDENHNKFHNEETAFFGFFECVDDQEVASALLDAVAQWGKARGMKTLRGPVNPSTNHEVGLLIEGFEDTPAVMMTYNPPFYAKLFEAWGLRKAKDLYSYSLFLTSRFSERILAHAERLKIRGRVKFRPIDLGRFEEEVDRVLDIYNDAWETNWGFVPMTPEEFRHTAKDMKLLLDPRFLLIAEVNGEPAGFSLALPDANLAIQKVKDGRLLPFGVLKLLWHLKGPARKKTVRRIRVLTLGIKKKFREAGIGPLLYAEYIRLGKELDIREGEASWILEDNIPMNKALQQMGAERKKVYRVYDRPLVKG